MREVYLTNNGLREELRDARTHALLAYDYDRARLKFLARIKNWRLVKKSLQFQAEGV